MNDLSIFYKGKLIRENLSFEECAEVLDELSQMHYDTEEYNPQDIKLEMNNG